jgi:hypothetical protein
LIWPQGQIVPSGTGLIEVYTVEIIDLIEMYNKEEKE